MVQCLASNVAVSLEVLVTVTFEAAVPAKLTVAPEAKFVPVIVTVVPPEVVPELGETDVTVGACGRGFVYV